jgi:hypothetical protein
LKKKKKKEEEEEEAMFLFEREKPNNIQLK